MKKMLVAMLAMTMSASAMAQEANQNGVERRQFDKTEMIKTRTNETAQKLGLNEEQTAKLLELNTQYADKLRPQMRGPRPGGPQGRRPEVGDSARRMRPENAQGRPSREEMEKMREEMRANQEAYDAELQKILTEEQFKTYKAEEQKRMQNMRRGGQRGQGGPRGQRSENRD